MSDQLQDNIVIRLDDERRNIRYPSSDGRVIHLVRVLQSGEEHLVPALVMDESHTGLGCVLIGPPPADAEAFWYQETDKIRTRIVVRRSEELAVDVQRIGFELTGEIDPA